MIRFNYILASIVSITVMMVSVPAWAVIVPNFSFENFTGPLNTGNQPNFNDWTETSGHIGRPNGSIDRTATNGTVMLTLRRNNIPNGVQDNVSVFQTLSETIDTTQIYTLTVDVGRALNGSPSPAGGELYWINAGTPTRIAATSYQPGGDAFTTLNLQVSGAELTGLGGQQLGIRLFTTAISGGQEVAYDNVRLTKVAAPTPAGAPATITVPDFSFEASGVHDTGNWTNNPVIWGGSGFPITGTGYGQTPTNLTDIGVNTSYQLLTDKFIEGATYTLTVDHSLRGDGNGQEFDTGSIMFFRQDQSPGGPTTNFIGPTIGILDGSLANGNNPADLVAGDWVTQTLTYVATAADAGRQIGIMVTTASAYQGVYDNVRLTVDLAQEAEVVPEPCTYALAMTGLAGLGVAAWRKRRQRK